MEIHTADNMPLKNLDDLVDRMQSDVNFAKLNRPGNKATRVEKTISGFLENSINSKVKKVAGSRFVKANSGYRTLRGISDQLSQILGPGENRVESLMKTVFSPQTGERTKQIFRAVKDITGKDLINESVLAKFAMDAMGDIRGTNLLEALNLGKGFAQTKQ